MATKQKKGPQQVPVRHMRAVSPTPDESPQGRPVVKWPEGISDEALSALPDNTNLRALLVAVMEGPTQLADELKHARITPPSWITEAQAGPLEAVLEAKAEPPPPYEVFQTTNTVAPDEHDDTEYVGKVALSILANLAQAPGITPQLSAYLNANAPELAEAFAREVDFGRAVPSTFVTPTSVPNVFMDHRVVFGYDEASQRLVCDWQASPRIHR